MNVVNLVRMLMMERRFSTGIYNQIPEERADYRPEEGMMSMAAQLAHIGAFDEWLYQGLKYGNWAVDAFTDRPESTVEEALAFMEHARSRLLGLTEELDNEGINSPVGPNPVFAPAMHVANVVMMTLSHECHHRGQLVVYLRTLGIQPSLLYDLSHTAD